MRLTHVTCLPVESLRETIARLGQCSAGGSHEDLDRAFRRRTLCTWFGRYLRWPRSCAGRCSKQRRVGVRHLVRACADAQHAERGRGSSGADRLWKRECRRSLHVERLRRRPFGAVLLGHRNRHSTKSSRVSAISARGLGWAISSPSSHWKIPQDGMAPNYPAGLRTHRRACRESQRHEMMGHGIGARSARGDQDERNHF